MKLGDFFGTWYVNTQKKIDSKKLSARKKMTDHRKWIGNGKKIENIEIFCVYNLQIPHDAEKNA